MLEKNSLGWSGQNLLVLNCPASSLLFAPVQVSAQVGEKSNCNHPVDNGLGRAIEPAPEPGRLRSAEQKWAVVGNLDRQLHPVRKGRNGKGQHAPAAFTTLYQ